MLTLVANGTPPSPELVRALAKRSEGVAAIDGGLAVCDRAGIEPDLILGDLDSAPLSLLEKYRHIPQIETPDQDKTDLEKAVEYLFNFRFETFSVCGALGKRIDHTLTNIYLLCRYPCKIIFESEDEICFALTKMHTLNCRIGQTVSLIPISSEVSGVTTKGLKWEMNNKTLNKTCVSISNVALQEKVMIAFEEGDLLVAINT